VVIHESLLRPKGSPNINFVELPLVGSSDVGVPRGKTILAIWTRCSLRKQHWSSVHRP